jgi:deazaflavin-dependent oxidoreductase (nitroreductase family)
VAKKSYSRFNLIVQKLASTRAGSWILARTLPTLDRFILKLTAGRKTMTGILSGVSVLLLTTTGARSRVPRTHPLLCLQDECTPDVYAVVASNWGQQHYPAWYYNLKANPQATIKIGGQVGEYTAHEASGEEYNRLWQCALDSYLGFPFYKKRAGSRHIPIMVLRPVKR